MGGIEERMGVRMNRWREGKKNTMRKGAREERMDVVKEEWKGSEREKGGPTIRAGKGTGITFGIVARRH